MTDINVPVMLLDAAVQCIEQFMHESDEDQVEAQLVVDELITAIKGETVAAEGADDASEEEGSDTPMEEAPAETGSEA